MNLSFPILLNTILVSRLFLLVCPHKPAALISTHILEYGRTDIPFTLFQTLSKGTVLLLGSVFHSRQFRQLAINLQKTTTNLGGSSGNIIPSLCSPPKCWDCSDGEETAQEEVVAGLPSSCGGLVTQSPGKQESPAQLLRQTGLGADWEVTYRKKGCGEWRKAWVVCVVDMATAMLRTTALDPDFHQNEAWRDVKASL